jgi:hypothetical protein
MGYLPPHDTFRYPVLGWAIAVACALAVSCGKFGYDVSELDETSASGGSAGEAGSGGTRSFGGGFGFGGSFGGGAGAGGSGRVGFGGAGGFDASAGGGDSGVQRMPESGVADVVDARAACPSGIVMSGQVATAIHGGSGGTAYADVCPAGEVVVGYVGYTTTTQPIVVDWLQTVCGTLSVTASAECQVTVSPGATLTGRGRAAGAGPWTVMCPPNQMVVAFHGQAGFDLDQVSFECAPLVILKSFSGYRLSIGAGTSLPAQGGTTGPTFQDGCPPNQIAVGTNTHAGQIIYELGLYCSTPALTP